MDGFEAEVGEFEDGEGVAGGEDDVVEFSAIIMRDRFLEEGLEFVFQGGWVGEVDWEAVEAGWGSSGDGGVGGLEGGEGGLDAGWVGRGDGYESAVFEDGFGEGVA